ncbi:MULTISPECIES: hypothetical protein [Vibrio]|uniref:hypothetical protein n=1 Tax=Vibrio TaxID=662 RepID=UPI00111CBD02|nr:MULTISPECIES: hypothetical protein [Vibrio]MDW3057880.1 hypothetical protein [Vibrio sp. 1978]TOL78780.1 hypothetical protein CGH90_19685 [Vibrio parahaemolyticus]
MAKINHSRPYLRYVDNIRRELSKASAQYRQSPNKSKASLSAWDKMSRIELTDVEEKSLFDIIELSTSYIDLSCEIISLIMVKGSSKKRKKLNAKREEVHQRLQEASDVLVASEMLNQMNGRSSGVFDWWKLLQSILDKEGVTELQEIADDVFAMSFKKIERVIEEAGKG